MQVILILLAILVGQYVHIYLKWTEYRKNDIAEKEDNFLYFLKTQIGAVLARGFIFVGLALWIGLTSAQARFEQAFTDMVWPFYASIGYAVDSFLKNLFTAVEKKKVI